MLYQMDTLQFTEPCYPVAVHLAIYVFWLVRTLFCLAVLIYMAMK